MFRKNYFTFLLATALFLMSGVAVFAQNAPVYGRVELTKADGTKVPAVGALVEMIRLDQRVKPVSDKTDKKGNFAFAGVTLGGKYVISVSGEGLAPAILPNIVAGMDKIVVPVTEGDGKRWSEDEVKQSVSSRTNTNTTTNTTTTTNTVSEDDKKREEEIKKQNEKILAENEKIKNANDVINASQKEGNAALAEGYKFYDAKNYSSALDNFTTAISKYDQGYNAAPTFTGSAPIFLNKMAVAYIERIKSNIRLITKENRATIMESIKNDSQKVVESSGKSIELLKTAVPKDEKQKTDFEELKSTALKLRKNAYFLSIRNGADLSKGKEAIVAFQEYLESEKVPDEKFKVQLEFADVLFDLQEADKALAEYEKILASNPNNLEAMAGAGFTLVTIAYTNNEDKTKFQLAVNYLQKFYDAAPSTHPRKEDAKIAIDQIKKDYKITPKK